MKLYYLDAPADRSPLDDLSKFGLVSVERTDDPLDADVYLAHRFSYFTEEIASRGRLNICWTHEPYICTHFEPRVKMADSYVHIFNVFNTNVYTDNFYYCATKGPLPLVRTEADLNVSFGLKRAAAVMTYKRGVLPYRDRDVSFGERRNAFGLSGSELGLVDVFGARWPEGVSRGSDRDEGDRHNSKLKLLSGYNFSAAFENTSWDYYTTEKLWEAIQGGTLPIYSESDTIHQTFDEGALLQFKNLEDLEALLRQISDMTFTEYKDRINYIRDVYNRLDHRRLMLASRARAKRQVGQFILSHLG